MNNQFVPQLNAAENMYYGLNTPDFENRNQIEIFEEWAESNIHLLDREVKDTLIEGLVQSNIVTPTMLMAFENELTRSNPQSEFAQSLSVLEKCHLLEAIEMHIEPITDQTRQKYFFYHLTPLEPARLINPMQAIPTKVPLGLSGMNLARNALGIEAEIYFSEHCDPKITPLLESYLRGGTGATVESIHGRNDGLIASIHHLIRTKKLCRGVETLATNSKIRAMHFSVALTTSAEKTNSIENLLPVLVGQEHLQIENAQNELFDKFLFIEEYLNVDFIIGLALSPCFIRIFKLKNINENDHELFLNCDISTIEGKCISIIAAFNIARVVLYFMRNSMFTRRPDAVKLYSKITISDDNHYEPTMTVTFQKQKHVLYVATHDLLYIERLRLFFVQTINVKNIVKCIDQVTINGDEAVEFHLTPAGIPVDSYPITAEIALEILLSVTNAVSHLHSLYYFHSNITLKNVFVSTNVNKRRYILGGIQHIVCDMNLNDDELNTANENASELRKFYLRGIHESSIQETDDIDAIVALLDAKLDGNAGAPKMRTLHRALNNIYREHGRRKYTTTRELFHALSNISLDDDNLY